MEKAEILRRLEDLSKRTIRTCGKPQFSFCMSSDDCTALESAIDMIKEQEPIEPTINEYGEAYCICGENVGIIPRDKNLPSIRSKYCSECGRRMKWKYD